MPAGSASLPAPGSGERRLATGAMRALGILAVPVLAVAGLAEGVPGALGAAVGLGFVALLFGASAWALSWAVRRGHRSALGVLLGGAVGRLMLYAGALTVLSRVDMLHRTSLALATAVAVAVTLAYELRLLARTPQLFWVETEQQGAGNP